MASLGRAAALLALLTLGLAGAAAPAAESHLRACGAAFDVLRRCAAAGQSRDDVRSRCCSLLDAYTANGCLCPNCPPDAAAATSAEALRATADLAPLMAACDPLGFGDELAPGAILSHLLGQTGGDGEGGDAGDGQGTVDEAAPADSDSAIDDAFEAATPDQLPDEDDLAADMAGLSAAAHDPRQPAGATPRVPVAQAQGGMADTPADDYDNMLSDADAAFQLVDPAVAAAYAAAAGNSGSSAAAGAAAASAGLGGEAQLGLYQLLEAAARPSADVAPGEEEGEQEGESDEAAQQAAEMELELVASAAAVDDSGSDDGAAGFDDAAVRLAAPDQIPDSADQRRAAALATALEASQAQHLAAARRQQRRVTAGRASQDGSSTLSLDITVDADSPEAARRMAQGLTTLLHRWHAAEGNAASQAELAGALEDAALRMAAAANTALGRAGLQPKQVLLQQVEEQRQAPGATCACMGAAYDSADGLGLEGAALRRRYVAARLALCRFACQHQQTLTWLLVAELALCLAWLGAYLVRGCTKGGAADADEEAPSAQQQFVIASAADPQWQAQAELRQPLLDRAGSSSDSC